MLYNIEKHHMRSKFRDKFKKTPCELKRSQHIPLALLLDDFCQIFKSETFFFPALVNMSNWPHCRARDVQPHWTIPKKNVLPLPHTEERGQDCMCCGLHLKCTPPEEALVVHSERWRRTSDGFHWLDLNEEKRQTDISRQTEVDTSDEGWTFISVCFVNTSAGCSLRFCIFVVQRHQTWFWLWPVMFCEVLRGNLWNTHECYSPFACQKYDWWCWTMQSNFNHLLLFEMKDLAVLWC